MTTTGIIALGLNAYLRPLEEEDAEDLFALTEANRQRLREWLPWLDHIKRVDDSLDFIRTQKELAKRKEALSCGLFVNEKLAGVVSFNKIDRVDAHGEIGYWIDLDAQGKGLMTAAVKALADYGFSALELRKVVIRCATGNTLSQSIPKRLGFRLVKMIPQNENLYGRLVDHYEYELEYS